MNDRDLGPARKGLFGEVARSPSTSTDVLAERQTELTQAMRALRIDLCLQALALAALDPDGGRRGFAPPAIESNVTRSGPARMADVGRSWFSYWARELDTHLAPSARLWSLAMTLQGLHEAGALVSGSRVGLVGERLAALAPYLATLGVEGVLGSPADATPQSLAAFCSAESASSPLAGVLRALRGGGVFISLFDFAFKGEPSGAALSQDGLQAQAQARASAGFAVRPLTFDLGDHPLDMYVAAADEEIAGRTPFDLRAQRSSCLVTPFIIVAEAV